MHSKERKHAVILKNVSLKIDICKKDIGCGDSRDHSRFKFQDRHPNLSLTLATNSTRTSVIHVLNQNCQGNIKIDN